MSKWPDILSKLLEKGVDVNHVVLEGQTPLHAAAYRAGHENQVVRLLLDNGADPNVTTRSGSTALHIAVEGYGDTSTAEMLLSAGANINASDRNGATALLFSCRWSENIEIVQLLLSHGADVNTGTAGPTTWYPIHAACDARHYDIAKLLLEYNADVNVRAESCKGALHCATESATRQRPGNDAGSALTPVYLAPLYTVVAALDGKRIVLLNCCN